MDFKASQYKKQNPNFGISFCASPSLEKRQDEVSRITQKFPDRIPIIVEKHPKSKLPDIDKTK